MAESNGPFASCFVAALATGIGGLVTLDAGSVMAANLRKLSGTEIRNGFAGKQLTTRFIIALSMRRTGRCEASRWA